MKYMFENKKKSFSAKNKKYDFTQQYDCSNMCVTFI